MTNSRRKGKRIERLFAKKLRSIFPNIERNANTQSRDGGLDLINTGDFAFEVKGGKQYKSVMIRKIIDQTQEERQDKKYAVALVKPDREDPYAIIPFDDFVELISD